MVHSRANTVSWSGMEQHQWLMILALAHGVTDKTPILLKFPILGFAPEPTFSLQHQNTTILHLTAGAHPERGVA
jgi:hypothetical protein